ncbi:MAG: glycosyltransferase family 39 protein [Anaerolineae bacterium]|nr:glycosyltransferase family 39 protein [Anaerolineae bacterium]
MLKSIFSIPYITRPAWEYHEADYYNVVRFILSEQRFPTREDYPNGTADVRQATQPPLYFLIALPVLAIADSNQPVPAPPQPPQMCLAWEAFNPSPHSSSDLLAYPSGVPSPATARAILRILNVALSCAAVILTALTVLKFMPQKHGAALIAAALLAFEPTLFQYTKEINNDSLLLFLTALNLYFSASLIVSSKLRLRDILGITVTLVLAILTRLNGWAIVGVNVLLFFIYLRQRSAAMITPKRRRRIALLVGALSLAIIGVIALNLILYGSVFGRYAQVEAILATNLFQNFTLDGAFNVFAATLRDLSTSYSQPVNLLSSSARLPPGYVLLTVVMLALAGLGAVRLWRRNRPAVWLPLLFVASATFLVFVRNFNAIEFTTDYSTTFIFTPLRYFVTGLPAAALFIAIGLSEIRFASWIAAGLTTLYAVLLLLGILNLPKYVEPPEVDLQRVERELLSLETSANADPEFPQIIAYHLTMHPDQQAIELNLYSEAVQPLSSNYAIRIEIVGANGNTMRCQFLPAEGAYPSAYWKQDDIVQTNVMIPICGENLIPGNPLFLRWASTEGVSDAIHLGWITEPLMTAEACPSFLGDVDDSLKVIRYTGPLQSPVGTLYLPSVNWLTVNVPLRAITRVYVLREENGTEEFTCEGQPRLNTKPFSIWLLGETTYFDECPLEIPEDAPIGRYQVFLGAKDINGDWLPAKGPDGTLSPDHLIYVETIELTSAEESGLN